MGKIAKILGLLSVLLITSIASAQPAQVFEGFFKGAGEMMTSNVQKNPARIPAGTTGQVLVMQSNGYPAWVSSGVVSSITLPTDTYLISNNNAGSGTLNLLKSDSIDDTVLNAKTGKTIKLSNNGFPVLRVTATGLIAANGALLAGDVTQGGLNSWTSSATVPQISIEQATADANGNIVNFYKSRKTDGTADTIVSSGDGLGDIYFLGSNGATFDKAAAIEVTIDSTPGSSADMPGAIDFQVSPDGSATLASALKLENSKRARFFGPVRSDNANDFICNVGLCTLSLQESTAGTACSGTLTSNGTSDVATSTTCATTGSRIFLTRTSAAAFTDGYIKSISNGTSFTYTGTNASDSGTYNWIIFHEAP